MLLVCDVSTGIPCEYYYVKESKGGDLTVNDEGLLLWDVKELRTVLYTALNCANPEWIECQWHRYAFDDTGALVMQEKTDTIKWE